MANYSAGGRNSENNRQKRPSAADKIAEQRRRKTALEEMQAPRLKNKNRKTPIVRSEESDSRNKAKKPKKNNKKMPNLPNTSSGRVYSKQKAPSKPLFGKRQGGLSSGKLITGGIIIVVVLAMFYMLTNKNAVEVFVDGNSMGVVMDKSFDVDYIKSTCTAKLVSSLGTNVEVTSEIETKKVHTSKNNENVSTADYMIKSVNDALKYNVEATTIVINGNEMAVVSSAEAAQTVVDRILSEQKLSYIEDTSSIVEGPEISGLEFSSKYVDGSEIMTTDRAYEQLSGTKQQQFTYTVEAGDSFGKIASSYGLTVSELMASNPNITDATRISVGDQINVNATVPMLDIKVVTQTVDRSSGSAVIVRTTYINGVETDSSTIDSSSQSSADDTEDTEGADETEEAE